MAVQKQVTINRINEDVLDASLDPQDKLVISTSSGRHVEVATLVLALSCHGHANSLTYPTRLLRVSLALHDANAASPNIAKKAITSIDCGINWQRC